VRIGVPKEAASGERRVALVPKVVRKLSGGGHAVVVEVGAGEAARAIAATGATAFAMEAIPRISRAQSMDVTWRARRAATASWRGRGRPTGPKER
jgi:NAD/NADP transhydrogenase alpha subunit